MKWILVLISLLLLNFHQVKNINQVLFSENDSTKVRKHIVRSTSSNVLLKNITKAWDVTWSRFYHEDTQQFYDYLSSYGDGQELSHLPTADEVSRQYPNIYGYDTGMEDCMISAGVILNMIIDQYAVTKNERLKKNAFSVFQGIQRSATVHGMPGFLARCVCAEDLKSIYINSSRDQYTHAVHGLWAYFHSPLSSPEIRIEIGKVLSAFADRMKRNVIPENNYDFLRADGTRDTRGISKMWNVMAHEAARLPMIYAAAWEVTGNQEYFNLYRKYIESAIEQSFEIEEKTTTYALLQMQSSMELLVSIEQDPEIIKDIHKIMSEISKRSAKRAIKASKRSLNLDLTMVGDDWRTGEGISPEGEYRKVWYNIRERGESALAQLMSIDNRFPNKQKVLLVKAIKELDYERVSSNGIFYLQGAYWKARKLGIFQKED